MTFVIGLTGSIGMGKSTTAALFEEEGCEVWDADAAVHRLYGIGGAAVVPVQAAFPEAVEEGAVSRVKLKNILREKPEALRDIERIVHPLVVQDRARFLEETKADIVVLDIPLLFETGADKATDATVCVTVDATTQKARVLARGKMSETEFEVILGKQMPDAEKRERSDFVIVTDTLDNAREQVRAILQRVRGMRHA
ncbi:MAG: dephospho-CoA kinase [Pseudomonadota bacterium]